jgi:predicted transcriptional regulator
VVAVKSAKDEVRDLLASLPDDASLEDIQYHLYVRQKIQRGLKAAEEGRTIAHEEVVRRMRRWLEK